jgi:hypothetical protein
MSEKKDLWENAEFFKLTFVALLTYAFKLIRWDEKAGLHGMRYAPNNRRARSTRERRPAVKKMWRATGTRFSKSIN